MSGPASTDPHATAADPDVVVDLSAPHRIHIVGIGGAAMSAIARILLAMGHTVSGSDLTGSPAADRLLEEGLTVSIGHDAAHVPADVDLVAVSTAIPEHNPELVEARRRGVPVGSREAMMVAILRTRPGVAVAGTHGKTTTSSMLALALRDAGLDPSYIIGGELKETGSGAAWGSGDLFVVEADESDGSFLALPRRAAIVTNIEPDHLEHYGGVEQLEAAFRRFLADTPGLRLVCADDPVAARLGREVGARSYGTAADADYRMVDVEVSRQGARFTVQRDDGPLVEVVLPVPGMHNASNACAALAAAVELGAAADDVAAALARFGGVGRRFEPRGEAAGVTFIDDYAHLPTEVAAMVTAAGAGDWARLVVVFQPHRYSRTGALWRDFAHAFVGADLLVVTDIYPAGEPARPGVTGKLIVDAVLDAHPHQRVAYLPGRDDVVRYLEHELRPGDLCLTLGAGDLTTLPDVLRDARLGRSVAGAGDG